MPIPAGRGVDLLAGHRDRVCAALIAHKRAPSRLRAGVRTHFLIEKDWH